MCCRAPKPRCAFKYLRHLHALHGSGGRRAKRAWSCNSFGSNQFAVRRARLKAALQMVHQCTMNKTRQERSPNLGSVRCMHSTSSASASRQDVKNWPAYLVTLLKKFDADAAAAPPQARSQDPSARCIHCWLLCEEDRQERLEDRQEVQEVPSRPACLSIAGKEGRWLCIHGLHHSGEVATAADGARRCSPSHCRAEVWSRGLWGRGGVESSGDAASMWGLGGGLPQLLLHGKR